MDITKINKLLDMKDSIMEKINGTYLIHELIKYQKIDLIKEYINEGYDLNLVDKNFNTPYHLILKDYYNVDLLKKMINKKTCWHNMDFQKNSILSLIISSNRYFEDLSDILLKFISQKDFENEERLNYLACLNLKIENIIKIKNLINFSLPEKKPGLFQLIDNNFLNLNDLIINLNKLNLTSYQILDFYGNSLFTYLLSNLIKNNEILKNLPAILDGLKKLEIKMDHLNPINGEQPFRIMIYNEHKLGLTHVDLINFYNKNKINPNRTTSNGINLGMFMIMYYKNHNKEIDNFVIKILENIDDFYQVNMYGENLWDYLKVNYPKYLNKFNHKKKENIKIFQEKQDTSSLATYFRARLDDILIYFHLLETKHKNLIVPRINTIGIKNTITFDGSTMSLPTNLDLTFNDLPYFISFQDKDNYNINPYLNLLINKIKNEGQKDYAVVFLSLISKSGNLHANILLYDFMEKRIERFEPYGDTTDKENDVNDILEEELTWNTGLSYLSNQHTSPYAGVQALSDESNELNEKPGDFGGFCLAWCLWYVEMRLNNPDINPKELINKSISKIIQENKEPYLINHIRNYGNKITKEKFKIYETIKLDKNIWTNLVFDDESNEKIENFLMKL